MVEWIGRKEVTVKMQKKKNYKKDTMNNEQETAQLRREIADVATSFQLNNMNTSTMPL